MKKTILILIFVLCISSVLACDKSVVRGNVENHEKDMYIQFYCDGELVGSKNIISKYGNYQKSLDYCSDNLYGELYYNDTLFDTQIAVNDGLCDYSLNYSGIIQVPEFGLFGGLLASIGSIVVYKFRKNKI